jgi:hypothetical protein
MNEFFLILAALLVVVLIMSRRCDETEHFLTPQQCLGFKQYCPPAYGGAYRG